jgi:hypothetical protein
VQNAVEPLAVIVGVEVDPVDAVTGIAVLTLEQPLVEVTVQI